MKRLLLGLGLALPLAAWADPPEQSLRPVAPGQLVGETVLPAELFLQTRSAAGSVAPGTDAPVADVPEPAISVPEGPASVVSSALPATSARASNPGALGVTAVLPEPPSPMTVARTPRPRTRPAEVSQTARAAVATRRSGAVCSDLAIQGVAIGRVSASHSGCGIDQAVRVSSVSGVGLSTHAVMDCGTARALKSWIDRGLKPAVGSYGGGVRQLQVVAHYACRPRNNQKGARISEHGKGRAVDIAAVKLADGKELNVLQDWQNGREGRILHQVHDAACGPFGTVLGPEANALHRNHFHFDTARYRNGSYCR
ncbi:extensin-like domain-containing protein [Pseudooceanicola algae]|uniref:Extensin-like C-terminal domain-containing protein n=1 Tax=Pseudooceanicola algae TaxID=1537215 RepID=A0A418SIB7_9RHOB|nr:extensin family protein [Pseudooceanicola algae]QPM92067.1 hypothetical protein PSAL_033300 [Pseudooceanicola algae]